MRQVRAVRLTWMVGGVLLAVVGSRDVRAEPDHGFGVVTLDLRPEGGDVPTHLCVVSEAKSSRTRHKLWEALEAAPSDGVLSGARERSWRVLPWVWSGDEQSVENQRCTEDPIGDCRPRVELPNGLSRQSDLYVACAADSLTEGTPGSEPRPLFILLEYLEGSPPQIESVRLTGGVATIGVSGASFERVVVTGRSLGGHYLPHRRSERGQADPGVPVDEGAPKNRTIVLRLTSRCRTVEVRLPRTTIKPTDRARLSARVHGHLLHNDRCVSHLVGSEVMQLRIPPAPLGVGSIDVELVATESEAAARFGGSFEGAWPKTPFALTLNQVAFTWTRPACIYPEDRCPVATLETGTTCSATLTRDGCNYRCPGNVSEESAISLDLPLEVTFEKDEPKQRWHDKLAQNGQVLTGYVPADEIYLQADLHRWRTETPDNRIGRVEIYGEDGEAHRYGVTRINRLVLKVPGASCEPVRFKPSGDRDYEEAVATVDEGKLDFGNPDSLVRRVNFNVTLALGGGPAWSDGIETPPLYFSGLGLFAVQVRPQRTIANRFAFELRAGITLGQWATTVTDEGDSGDDSEVPAEGDTASTTGSEELRRFGWARVLFEPGLVASLHSRVSLGVGVGVGFSLPFRNDKEDLTNKSLNFIWSPNVDLRFRLRRWLRLVIQFRGVLGEKAFYRENDEPEQNETEALSILILFGLQAAF